MHCLTILAQTITNKIKVIEESDQPIEPCEIVQIKGPSLTTLGKHDAPSKTDLTSSSLHLKKTGLGRVVLNSLYRSRCFVKVQ